MILTQTIVFVLLWFAIALSYKALSRSRVEIGKVSNWRLLAVKLDKAAEKGRSSLVATRESNALFKGTRRKPLTLNQKRANGKLLPLPRLRVVRDVSSEGRLPLSNFTVGQQLVGKIISITNYGIFVDIGSEKDGLVHIKDTSGTYFMEKSQVDRIFSPGQHIDVWIKFIDPLASKLGLQMYPPRPKRAEVDITMLEVGSEIAGKAVKHSEYGVFLDIGAGDDLAFLPKRKMKVNSRMLRWNPWEIVPLGTEVNCLVHEVFPKKRTVSLTTFEVHEWDDKLPLRLKEGEGPYADMVDPDDEKLGGTVEANIIRLRREYEDVKFEDVVDEEEEDPEYGMQRLKDKGGVRGKNIVIDDFAETDQEYEGRSAVMSAALGKSEEGRPFARTEKNMGVLSMDSRFDQDTDEVWESFAGDFPYVTVTKLMKWERIKFYVEEDMLTQDTVEEIMKSVGCMHGKLFKEEFQAFLDELSETLDLKERDSKVGLEWDETTPYRLIPDNPQWTEEIWRNLTSDKTKKARLSFTDVLAWPAVDFHLEMGLLTVISVERMFQYAVGRNGLIGHDEFFVLVERLYRHVKRVYLDNYREGYQVTDQNDPNYEEVDFFGRPYSDASTEEPEVDTEAEEDTTASSSGNEAMEEAVSETVDDTLLSQFESLSAEKSFVSLKNLKKWDLIDQMKEKGILDDSKIKAIVDRLTLNRKLTADHWPTFCSELMQLNDQYELEKAKTEARLAPSTRGSDGVYDVNVDADFRSLAGDRSTIRYEEMMQYPLIESLIKQEAIDKITLKRLIVKLARKTRVVKKNALQRDAVKNMNIDVDLFNAILEEVLSVTRKE